MNINWNSIRKEFPLLKEKYPVFGRGDFHGESIAYLDNAASTPMPLFLQKKFCEIFNKYYSNVHRGAHYFSIISTVKYEEARKIAMDFIGGDKKTHEIIFAYNTTDALNLAAHLIKNKKGIVLASEMEHHSNYLPYLRDNVVELFCVDEFGNIDYADLEKKLKKYDVKLVAVSGVSNVTGILSDIGLMAKLAHKYGAKILIDGAQALAHMPLDVKKYGIDFFAGAGHKMYAPGVAFLYAPRAILDEAESYRPGGGTINYVLPDEVNYSLSPERHEGGTPNIAGAIVLGEAMKWLKKIGMKNIRKHEMELFEYLVGELKKIPQVKIYPIRSNPAVRDADMSLVNRTSNGVYGDLNFEWHLGLVSFNIENIHHSLAVAILNYEAGAAIRNGCHCAHIYLKQLLKLNKKDIEKIKKILAKKQKGITETENLIIPGTLRASLGIFNNKKDVDKLIRGVKMIAEKKWKRDYIYENGAYKLRIK
ncbi:MAG: hypothetical protein US76_03475 [Parcubacteria group bacterium GW2011_GWA2_38_13b]|nr:MAG: hypothetical protein US76_03475 [Parcubacteria group bacterium GW2011_GWA2_38_13b]